MSPRKRRIYRAQAGGIVGGEGRDGGEERGLQIEEEREREIERFMKTK